jgi:hypothetical protein
MHEIDDWWVWVLKKKMCEVIEAYHVFRFTRDLKDYDMAVHLQDELNEAFGMSLDIILEIARAYNWDRLSHKLRNGYEYKYTK